GENEIGVGIGLDVVVDDEAHAAIGCGVERIHIVHVVDAAHLLLDGRGNSLFDGARVGPDIGGDDLNFRRNDVGKERYRKGNDGHGPDDDHNDGDDHRHDRPVDEELRHGYLLPA